MKLTLLFIVATAGSASVGAFQPAPKPTLAKNNVKQVNTSTGGSPPSPLTKSDMVAIRSPFGNSFPSTGDDANIDYVVDRDYGVALTLLCVGIWLSLFGPSKSSPCIIFAVMPNDTSSPITYYILTNLIYR